MTETIHLQMCPQDQAALYHVYCYNLTYSLLCRLSIK